mgnify:FL=1
MPRLTLMGMINYESNLLIGLQVPGCSSDMIHETIIMKMGDLYPYYQVPPVLKKLITVWSLQHQMEWKKMYDSLNAEYNPIENYDRQESWEDNSNGVTESSSEFSNTGHSDSTDTMNKSGFNTDSFVPDSQAVGVSNNNNGGKSSGNGKNTNVSTHTGRVHGNVGVTTNQQMIESEIALRTRFNLLDYVCGQFEKTFMVQVY